MSKSYIKFCSVKSCHINLLGGLLAAFLVVTATEAIISLLHANQLERQYTETTDKLASLRAQLEWEINSTLHLTRNLIAYVTTHPAVDETEFNELSSEIIRVGRNIRGIGLAKDNIITHLYPSTGNEAALGLEYKKIQTQWPAVKRAIDTKGTIVAGPVNLVQGGTAFIARTPIYTRSRTGGFPHKYKPEYWGLTFIVIDMQQLLQAAGIKNEFDGLELAMRGKDGLGEKGELIMGSAELFNADPILQSVMLPNGSWQIAAIPRGGWGVNISSMWLPRISGWLAALMIGSLISTLLWTRASNRQLALHDHLTGLPNRRLLEDRMEQMISRSTRGETLFGVFYIDLDGFKQVNDRFGHKAGDALLIEVTKRMLTSVRAMDTVARIGGDEFIILVESVSVDEDMQKIHNHLITGLTDTVFIESNQVDIRASIGAAIFPEDGRTIDELLKSADNSMYAAKHNSGSHKADLG